MQPKPEKSDTESNILKLYIAFMTVIIITGITDLFFDQFSSGETLHYIFEICYIIFALVSGSIMWFYYRRSYFLLIKSENRIGQITQDMNEWRTKHENVIHGIQKAITDQFAKWEFSSSEIEVALYIIRGYSHKQIAGLLEKSERTVRNQSLSIYKKSGMTGRSELAAFFLEDLFSFEELEN